MEQWGMKDHVRKLENDNQQLLAENAAAKAERDQFKAKFLALHRKQFKSGKKKHAEPAPQNKKEKKKRGPPMGHPPWNRPIPDHIDKVVSVPAPTVCPHCGRSSAESVTVAPPPLEKPKPDDADNASRTAAP